MKKTIIYGLLAVIGLSSVACSDDEELLEPTRIEDNHYRVSDDETGPEADLRREFFDKTKVNLLFSNILRRTYVGKDAFGDDVWHDETIDFNYNITNYGVSLYDFEFFDTDEEKIAAAEIVEKCILDHFSEPLRPFSVLAAKKLLYAKYDYQKLQPAGTFANMSCRAINVGDVMDMSIEEADDFYKSVRKTMLLSMISYRDDAFEEYRELAGQYAGTRVTDVIPDWDGTDETLLYEYGFLQVNFSWNPPQYDTFCDMQYDFEYDFYPMVMDYSPEEVEEMYGDYPMIIQKYNAVRNGIMSLGYVF